MKRGLCLTLAALTLLLCTAGEQPGFVLFYLNAPQNAAHLLAVPGQLTVPFGDGEASLAQCYAAAGPARCRQALLETLALPEDTLYNRNTHKKRSHAILR